MDVPRRIVILGKTGHGKSSLANTMFGEKMFKIDHTSKSGTSECQAETKSFNERRFTLIDTPGFFDTKMSEEESKPEIVRCITECAPGPHAFLIVLKVEKFTEHEQAVVDKIKEYFSEEAFRYATVIFTHGDQLQEGWTIEDFVQEDENLRDLVKLCGGRCHVIDNKYWNKEDEYRNNQFQIEQLIKTIDEMIKDNRDGYYTNKTLQAVETEIQQEIDIIKQLFPNLSEEEIRKRAKGNVFKKVLYLLAGMATGTLLGAFFGAKMMFKLARQTGFGQATTAVLVSEVVGAMIGGIRGFIAAEVAETPWEAARAVRDAVRDHTTRLYEQVTGATEGMEQQKEETRQKKEK
ncbi:GTPase IMAP family member 7-like [Xyrichtys novacula]|uniref:GTPase IMAP family member 7-like n=1 Tax=Xyrichtys novacula TaxID=13765 RepID=A0AAV1HLY8_XYRNO|nr:GTPase IMAP family member 7-like [Xyrichtys novacula]